MRCVIVADDLTGAADASAPLAANGLAVCIAPWSDAMIPVLRGLLGGPWDVVIAETDSREAAPEIAAGRVALVARELAPLHDAGAGRRPWVVKKVDSLLRGPIAAEVRALKDGLDIGDVVIAPALPSLGRTTEDGIQRWDGRPVDLPRVDGGGSRLADDAAVARACGVQGAVLVPVGGAPSDHGAHVCDARTVADLERLAAMLASRPGRPLLVGSSGLLGALGPHLAADAPDRSWVAPVRSGPVLVASLSPTGPARRQVAHLRDRPETMTIEVRGADAVTDPDAVGAELARGLSRALDPSTGARTVVLTVEEAAPDLAGTVRGAILAAVRTALRTVTLPDTVVINGGDTARAVLDAGRIGTLEVKQQLQHGAAVVTTDAGHNLVLKSGSFGPDAALADLVDAVTTGPIRTPTEG